MYTLGFSILWTVLFAIAVVFLWQDPDFLKETKTFRIAFSLVPLFGFLFIWDSLRKLRRFRSVREEEEGGQLWYVWTDLGGRVQRSLDDPRPAWDAEDRNFAD